MSLLQDISSFIKSLPAEVEEKKGVYRFSCVVAERKAFLSRRKLEYLARFRVDDAEKTVKFTEMLKESGSGISGGDAAPGFGFKTETYNTFKKERKGTIEEQSGLFGKRYDYRFDYSTIREKIKELTQSAGYEFHYQVTPAGL